MTTMGTYLMFFTIISIGSAVPHRYYTYEHGLNSNSIVRSSPLNEADRVPRPATISLRHQLVMTVGLEWHNRNTQSSI